MAYTNPQLAEQWKLVGTTLRIHASTLNIRTLKAFDEKNAFVGELTAQGKWGKFAHSLETRKLINAKIAANEINTRQADDPNNIFLRSQERAIAEKLEKSGSSVSDDANQHASVQASMRTSGAAKGSPKNVPKYTEKTASNVVKDLALELPETICAIN